MKEDKQLREIQRDLFQKLEERFGPCPAEHDHDYVFHMTVAIGGAPYENYEKAYQKLRTDKELDRRLCEESFIFSKLGLLYYDDDAIRPGTYFCYKVLDIR